MSDADKETFAPLILMTGEYESLFMSDSQMVPRFRGTRR